MFYIPETDNFNKYPFRLKVLFYLNMFLQRLLSPNCFFKKNTKIFCIGLSKTGTTSLTRALEILGIRASHYYYPLRMIKEKNRKIFVDLSKVFGAFDAFVDTPVARIYKMLYETFPEAKFILTVRDEESWFESFERHCISRSFIPSKTEIQLHRDLYGPIEPDRKTNIARYKYHNREVMEFFNKKGGNLLVMNIIKGDGWEKLCPFLSKKDLGVPFPKMNVSHVKKTSW